MIIREKYLNQLIETKDLNLIKVITGVRRSGKSTLLLQFKDYLTNSGIDKNNIILKDETCITLGKKYVDEFMFQYREYLIL